MMKTDRILLAHDSGGKLSYELLENVFHKYFRNEMLDKADDAAVISIPEKYAAYTTDSFVVKPLFFPGGDIGKLAVCGSLNDIAVQGARPLFMTSSFIIEEGFLIEDLLKIVKSMADCASENSVKIVAGDTKIVEKGACDGLFINTSCIGVFETENIPDISKISAGDKVIITGTMGDHGAALLIKRKELEFESSIISDCASLAPVLNKLMDKFGANIRFMRDPTRGGVAGILNEIAVKSSKTILLDEKNLPVSSEVNSICSILGLDPLYIANEGKAIVIVSDENEKECLEFFKAHTVTKNAVTIGEIIDDKNNKVVIKNLYGGKRLVSLLSGEQLPRIC